MDAIRVAETRSDVSWMFLERIYGHNTGYRFDPCLGESQLRNEPRCGELTIGIRIRQPTTLWLSHVAIQGNVRCERSRAPDNAKRRRYGHIRAAQVPSS
jgi:hypothetical protein